MSVRRDQKGRQLSTAPGAAYDQWGQHIDPTASWNAAKAKYGNNLYMANDGTYETNAGTDADPYYQEVGMAPTARRPKGIMDFLLDNGPLLAGAGAIAAPLLAGAAGAGAGAGAGAASASAGEAGAGLAGIEGGGFGLSGAAASALPGAAGVAAPAAAIPELGLGGASSLLGGPGLASTTTAPLASSLPAGAATSGAAGGGGSMGIGDAIKNYLLGGNGHKGIDPTTALLGGLSLFGPNGLPDSYTGSTTNPEATLANALGHTNGLINRLESRGPAHLRMPDPISVPGVPFQIGGGFGTDAAGHLPDLYQSAAQQPLSGNPFSTANFDLPKRGKL